MTKQLGLRLEFEFAARFKVYYMRNVNIVENSWDQNHNQVVSQTNYQIRGLIQDQIWNQFKLSINPKSLPIKTQIKSQIEDHLAQKRRYFK